MEHLEKGHEQVGRGRRPIRAHGMNRERGRPVGSPEKCSNCLELHARHRFLTVEREGQPPLSQRTQKEGVSLTSLIQREVFPGFSMRKRGILEKEPSQASKGTTESLKSKACRSSVTSTRGRMHLSLRASQRDASRVGKSFTKEAS